MNQTETEFMQGLLETIAQRLKNIDSRTQRIEKKLGVLEIRQASFDQQGSVSAMFSDVIPPEQKTATVAVKVDEKTELEDTKKRLENLKTMVAMPSKKKKSFFQWLTSRK